MKSTRVLICRSYPIAPDPRVEKEARALARAGYSVRVVAWDRTGKLPTDQQVNGVWICRLPIRAKAAKGLRNLPPLLRWQLGLLGWLVWHRREYDVIHACDFDTLIPAVWMRRWGHKKVIYDIFDFYADTLQRTPTSLKGWLRRCDLKLIGQVDGVILADDARREQIAGSNPRRLVVVVNSPEDAVGNLIAALKTPSSQLHLAYVGLLEIRRGLLDVLEVLSRHPEWTLDLAGFGKDDLPIRQAAKKLSNVHWHGEITYAHALELNAGADTLLAIYDPNVPNHRYASPNKVFEAMMLSKPIVVARGTNADCLIEQQSCGLVVDYGSLDALESALKTLAQDPSQRERLGRNGRLAYETTYSWQRMSEQLLTLYRDVLA